MTSSYGLEPRSREDGLLSVYHVAIFSESRLITSTLALCKDAVSAGKEVGAYRLHVHPASVAAHSASGVWIIGDGA